jgi:hypothetical protein
LAEPHATKITLEDTQIHTDKRALNIADSDDR